MPRRSSQDASFVWITTRRRALAALGAGLVVFGLAIAVELSESWRLLAYARPLNAASEADFVMANLAEARFAQTDVVLLLGGSAARELPPSDARMSALLTRRCGRPLRFVDAATSSQSVAEAWALAGTIPRNRLKLLVVGMNYERLTEGDRDVQRSLPIRGLPLASPRELETLLSRAGYPPDLTLPTLARAGWMLGNARRFKWRGAPRPFGAFVASGSANGRYQGPLNGYIAPPKTQAAKTLIARRMIIEVLVQADIEHVQATELWKRFVDRFGGPSSRVLFLALPESAALAPVDILGGATLKQDLAALGRYGARVEDWRTGSGLLETDFYDQQHLLASGRERIESRLVETLARSMTACS